MDLSLSRHAHPTRRALLAAALAVAVLAALAAGAQGGGAFQTILFAQEGPAQAGASASSVQAVPAATDPGTITFFPNVKMPCSTAIAGPIACGALLEPEVTSGPDGTIYVTAQEGVPGGVNLWRRDPGSHEYVHISKPDRNDPLTENTGLALGGGDNDLAVTTDGRILVATLSLVSAPVSYSTDRGKTFTKVELANGLVNVDRMWLTTVGDKTVYYAYHDNQASQIWLVKSTDGGESYSVPVPVIPPEMLPQSVGVPFVTVGNVQGDIVADPDGRVYMPFLSPKDVSKNATPMQRPDSYYVAVTDTNGENPVIKTVYEGDKDIMALFPAIASDLAGNLYATWSDRHGVFLSISRDHADTWSTPTKISTGKANASTVFPFVIAGTKGRVALAWLGTSAADNNDVEAKWHLNYAMTTDALKKSPTWTQVVASDHVVHEGAICLDGLQCDVTGGDRSLAEVLQMGLTKDGRVIISYPGTSTEDIAGWSYVAEQRFGPGLYANVKPSPPLPFVKTTPGGFLDGLLKKIGSTGYYLVGGAGGGTGLTDAEGNQVDSVGDIGGLSSAPGTEGHVASANEWTTYLASTPLVFEGAAVTANQILGGNLNIMTYLQEPAAAVETGAINVTLLDVPPEEGATPTKIVSGEAPYVAGIDPTKGSYVFKTAKPFEILKGHRLRLEIFAFRSTNTTTMRFYYGNATYPAGFTIDRFQRVAVQGTKTTKPSVGKGGLPATGVGDASSIGIALLLAAAFAGRRFLRAL